MFSQTNKIVFLHYRIMFLGQKKHGHWCEILMLLLLQIICTGNILNFPIALSYRRPWGPWEIPPHTVVFGPLLSKSPIVTNYLSSSIKKEKVIHPVMWLWTGTSFAVSDTASVTVCVTTSSRRVFWVSRSCSVCGSRCDCRNPQLGTWTWPTSPLTG